MGMIIEAKCDSCGKRENGNTQLNGVPTYPPGWFVVSWQKKNSGAKGSEKRLTLIGKVRRTARRLARTSLILAL